MGVIQVQRWIAVDIEDVDRSNDCSWTEAEQEASQPFTEVTALARDQLDAGRSHVPTISRTASALRSVQDALDKPGVEAGAQEVLVVAEAAVEVDVGLDALDDTLEERGAA